MGHVSILSCYDLNSDAVTGNTHHSGADSAINVKLNVSVLLPRRYDAELAEARTVSVEDKIETLRKCLGKCVGTVSRAD